MALSYLSSKPEGSVVKINESGVPVNYYVAAHNYPAAGRTYMLRYEVHYGTPQWSLSSRPNINNYSVSNLDNWLNTSFYVTLDPLIRSAITEVPVQSVVGGGNQSLATLQRKVFAPSAWEFGWRFSIISEGKTLPIAASIPHSHEGSRSPSNYSQATWLNFYTIGWYGDDVRQDCNGDRVWPVRCAFTLPSNVLVDDGGRVVVNTAPSVPPGINVPGTIHGGTTINVSWAGSADADGNFAGYIAEKSVNGGASWAQIYQGGGQIITDTVAFGTSGVLYRVKAYDTEGLHSGYCTSGQVTVINNRAPGTPGGISVPERVEGGKSLTVSWGTASDPDGNLAGYALEQSVNGGGFGEVFRGNALFHTLSVTKGWSTVAYRVRAYDAYAVHSGYVDSSARAVINNTPPTISCTAASGSNLGVKPEGFTVDYTVNDADGDAVNVTEAIDGVTRRSFMVASGTANGFAVTGETFMKLLNGAHTLAITAGDGKAETAYSLSFAKSVTEAIFTLTRALTADAMPEKCLVNIQGGFPAGSTLLVEICNNGNDSAPAWEDITTKALERKKHFFANKWKTAAAWGVQLRVTLRRGSAAGACFIQSIGGTFL